MCPRLREPVSKRPLGQAPVAAGGRGFFRGQRGVRPFLRVLGAFGVGGVVAEPELHLVVAPTAEDVVEPASARVASGQVRWVAQAARPEFGVEVAVGQVIGVQDVEAAQSQVVQEFPENGRERFVGEFSGRQERDVFLGELLRGRRPVFRFGGAELGFQFISGLFLLVGGDGAVHLGEAERVGFVALVSGGFLGGVVIAGQPAGVGFEWNG